MSSYLQKDILKLPGLEGGVLRVKNIAKSLGN